MSAKNKTTLNTTATANSGCISRLVRFFEIWGIFGPWSTDTWKTFFPPFRGWDVGCGYCRLEKRALRKRHCERAKRMGYAKCGVL